MRTILKKYIKYIFPTDDVDLFEGRMGDCLPKKQLSKIYTAPLGAVPPVVILDSNKTRIMSIRGRPRGSKTIKSEN